MRVNGLALVAFVVCATLASGCGSAEDGPGAPNASPSPNNTVSPHTFVYVMADTGLQIFEADPEPGGGLRWVGETRTGELQDFGAPFESSYLATTEWLGSAYPTPLKIYAIDRETGALSLRYSTQVTSGQVETSVEVTRTCVFVGARGWPLVSYRLAGDESLETAGSYGRANYLKIDPAGRRLFSFGYYTGDREILSWDVRPDCTLEERSPISLGGRTLTRFAVGEDLMLLSMREDREVRAYRYDATSGDLSLLAVSTPPANESWRPFAVGPDRTVAVWVSREPESILRLYQVDELGQFQLRESLPSGVAVFHNPSRLFFRGSDATHAVYGYTVDTTGQPSLFGEAAMPPRQFFYGILAVTPK